MASGAINGSTNNKYITARIRWSSSTNVSANTSSVTAHLDYRRTNSGYTTSGTLSGSININGNSGGYSKKVSIGTGWVEVASRTVTVGHNGDGTKKCWIGASGGISGTSLGSTSCGATVTLDTIPRASGMSLLKSSVATGESFTVNISPHSNSFSHWIDITGVGSQITYEVAAGVKSCTCTIPKDRVKSFTGSRNATATVYVNTKTGSGHDTKIGVVSKTIAITVPSDVKPTVGTPTFTDATKAYDVMGAYAAGLSQVTVSVPAKVYSGDFTDTATLKSVTATYAGTTYDAKSGSFSFKPTQSGNMTIVAVDSRGTSSSTYNKSVIVKPYEKPTVRVDASRCDEDGTADDTGTYAKVTATATLDTANVSENSATVILQYRERGADSWKAVAQKTIAEPQAITAQISASDTKPYELLAAITDKITSTQSAMILSNGEVPLDFYKGGKGIAIGKTAEQEGFDIGWPMMGAGFTKSVVDLIYPVGSIYMSVSPTDPSALLGGTWEQLKDRFLLAAGDTYAGGTTGGEASHKLTIDEIASHTHGEKLHIAQIGDVELRGGDNAGTKSYQLTKAATDGRNGSEPQVQTSHAGGGKAHNNMPPYLAVYMWERTA